MQTIQSSFGDHALGGARLPLASVMVAIVWALPALIFARLSPKAARRWMKDEGRPAEPTERLKRSEDVCAGPIVGSQDCGPKGVHFHFFEAAELSRECN